MENFAPKTSSVPVQFLGLPSPGLENADALLLPLPVENTVCYGRGTAGGPRAIIAASCQVETFDEETLVEFADRPRVHTLPPLPAEGEIEDCLAAIEDYVRSLPEKFLLALGGEHTVTYGLVAAHIKPRPAVAPEGWGGSSTATPTDGSTATPTEPPQPAGATAGRGFVDDLAGVTVVQIDAHADLADRLHGRRWSHGTVMRRLWERGCRLVQIGVRSLTREEFELASAGPRITTYYAHRLEEQWGELLDTLRRLEGNVYLTIDVDGLDPAVIASTGTPLPGGLSWRRMTEIIRVLTVESRGRLMGADIVEFVASPVPPGCDPAAARLATKLLAWWWKGISQPRQGRS